MMVDLNDGKVHSMAEVQNAGLNETAKSFSEGSEDLEKVLLNCWKNNIDTFACCKGVVDKDHDGSRQPYVSVLVTPENVDKVKKLMSYIWAQKENRPNMSVIKDCISAADNRTSVLIERTCLTNQGCKNVIQTILKATEDMENNVELNKNDETLEPVFEMLDSFVNRYVLSSNMCLQAKVFCPHNKSTPTFINNGSSKYKNKLTDKSLGEIKDFWKGVSVPVYKPQSKPQIEPVKGTEIEKTGYYEKTKEEVDYQQVRHNEGNKGKSEVKQL